MRKAILVFDFDGVLVDSYSKLEEVYIEALREHPAIKQMNIEKVKKLARELVELEDYHDSIRRYNRFELIETFLSTKSIVLDEDIIRRIVEKYWAKRIEKTTVFPDVEETLKELHVKYTLILLTDHDGKPGYKIRRVRASGLDRYFDEIIVAGEPGQPVTKRNGLLYIIDKYRVEPECIAFIDDKPKVLASVKDLGVATILRIFRPPNMYRAWTGEPAADYIIESLTELPTVLAILDTVCGKKG